jgi:release factor glutamine methyltransferase
VPTWRDVVDEAALQLRQLGIDDAEASARWIGRQATGTDAVEWSEIENGPVTERQLASFDAMVQRRGRGEPLQYVLGEWGFRTLDLMVDRRVLIPRPETEIVAEQALTELDRIRQGSDAEPVASSAQLARPPQLIVADLGTGSGAIGLAVAAERRSVEIWLTDRSRDALDVARANLAGLGVAGGSVRLAHGSWFDALPDELRGSLAVVVSNPPYVASPDDLDDAVRDWEPPEALLADGGGRADLAHLVTQAPPWLRADGALVLEMAPDQVDATAEQAAEHFAQVATFVDLAGKARGVVARHPRRRG